MNLHLVTFFLMFGLEIVVEIFIHVDMKPYNPDDWIKSGMIYHQSLTMFYLKLITSNYNSLGIHREHLLYLQWHHSKYNIMIKLFWQMYYHRSHTCLTQNTPNFMLSLRRTKWTFFFVQKNFLEILKKRKSYH